MAGATEVSRVTAIGVTSPVSFDPAFLSHADYDVIGSLSGLHAGVTTLSLDRNTIVFHPTLPFSFGERVQVRLSVRLLGGSTARDTFAFTTESMQSVDESAGIKCATVGSAQELPTFTVTVDNNPTPGKIFLATYGNPQFSDLVVLDQDGLVQKTFQAQAMDFQKQPNGLWTYFDGLIAKFIAVDTNFQQVRVYGCANGAQTDLHELLISPDGSYTLIGTLRTKRDMRQMVSGGDSASTVLSNVIQHFDASDALVFEWRGIDHYSILDANHEDLSTHQIDFQHSNSIEIDSLGNYLLSNRNLSEITKIDGKTGAIIWRLGGLHNQFQFPNDSLGFSYQHDARWLPHGHMTLFDNGNFRGTNGVNPKPESRAVEYVIDEQKMQAWLVWQHRHEPPVWASSMGSVQRLPNGNTFIGWGQNSTSDSVGNMLSLISSEVTPDDSLLFEMTAESFLPVFSYRTLKYPSAASGTASVATSGPTTAGGLLSCSIDENADRYAVTFSTAATSEVSIVLRDMLGRQIEQVFAGRSTGSSQKVSIPTSTFPNGMYYCVLRTSQASSTVPFTVVH